MRESFTLIEVLVSFTVMAIFAGLLFPGYRRINDRSKLLSSANKVAQNARRAQEMALSAEEVEGETQQRYGIRFDQEKSYRLYAVKEERETVLEEIELKRGVEIESLSCGEEETESVSIEFEPPEPETLIQSGKLDCSRAVVSLRVSDISPKTSVEINGAGLIYVED